MLENYMKVGEVTGTQSRHPQDGPAWDISGSFLRLRLRRVII